MECIKTILERLDLGQLDLFVAGLLVKTIEPGTHSVTRFAWNSSDGWLEPIAVHPEMGAIYAGGGGAQDLLRILRTIATQMNPSRAATPVEAATLASVAVTSILSGEQMRAGEGLASLYGGGFEFATVLNGKVVKVGDITHFFLDATRLENGSTKIHLRRAVTYDYQGDVLLVGTLELQMEWEYDTTKEEATMTMSAVAQGEPAVYAILPVHRSLTEEERFRLEGSPPVLHYCSRFTALYVHLPQRGSVVKSLVHYAGAHAPALGMKLEGAELEVSVNTSVLTKIRDMLN